MTKKLVLAGGGHAHLMLLGQIQALIREGYDVTVIQPSDHHYYSGMGPGFLGGTYEAPAIRFATRHVVEQQGGRFIRNKVQRIDYQTRQIVLQSGQMLPYDVLSCNTGSEIKTPPMTGNCDNIIPVKPIENLLETRRRVRELCAKKSHPSLAVVGGGPAAVEIACNLRKLVTSSRSRARISMYVGDNFLHLFSSQVQKYVCLALEEQHIAVCRSRVSEIREGKLQIAHNVDEPDLTLLATGVKPSRLFSDSGLPTGPSGGLLVNDFLQSVACPEIFGGGDCIDLASRRLQKVGVYAVRENPILARNIEASLTKKRMIRFHSNGKFLLLFNLGDGTAIYTKGKFAFRSNVAFLLKNYIDRRFIRHFQALEH